MFIYVIYVVRFIPIEKFVSTFFPSNCVKSVSIRNSSGPYFPAFRLNTGTYSVSFHIQSECGKIRIRKTLNADSFRTVSLSEPQ